MHFSRSVSIATLLAIIGVTYGQYNPHFVDGRSAIVHLFEWRWNDIALECERFLGPKGFGGVQISPPSENVLQLNPYRPWSERYTPVNYNLLVTRSGNEEELSSMIRRCNNVGVRIYVDAVINHLAGSGSFGKGTGGSDFDARTRSFPYFSASDFNDERCASSSGEIEDWQSMEQLRNCRIFSLVDLNQEKDYVRGQIIDYMNRLVRHGVAGFRIDIAKHMWPQTLGTIFNSLENLQESHGFPRGARPFIYQEVPDMGDPFSVIGEQYYDLGRVTEFRYGYFLAEIFRKQNELMKLWNWGEDWGMYRDMNALVFVCNHDTQRSHPNILTFRSGKEYKMATEFMLAHPYGVPKLMSSFYWDELWDGGKDKNDWIGPPHNENGDTLPVVITPDELCGNGWVCEHRWHQIISMVQFRNVVSGTGLNDWWDNGNNQIAFCRGDKGFIAMNNDNHPLSGSFQTCLPAGRYCDVISGMKLNNACTGITVEVGADGRAEIYVTNESEDPVLAIHVGSKL